MKFLIELTTGSFTVEYVDPEVKALRSSIEAAILKTAKRLHVFLPFKLYDLTAEDLSKVVKLLAQIEEKQTPEKIDYAKIGKEMKRLGYSSFDDFALEQMEREYNMQNRKSRFETLEFSPAKAKPISSDEQLQKPQKSQSRKRQSKRKSQPQTPLQTQTQKQSQKTRTTIASEKSEVRTIVDLKYHPITPSSTVIPCASDIKDHKPGSSEQTFDPSVFSLEDYEVLLKYEAELNEADGGTIKMLSESVSTDLDTRNSASNKYLEQLEAHNAEREVLYVKREAKGLGDFDMYSDDPLHSDNYVIEVKHPKVFKNV